MEDRTPRLGLPPGFSLRKYKKTLSDGSEAFEWQGKLGKGLSDRDGRKSRSRMLNNLKPGRDEETIAVEIELWLLVSAA